jgi:lipopolysaccharide export system permease protein
MVMYNGYSYSEMPEREQGGHEKNHPFRKDVFREQTIVVSLSGFDLQRTEIDLFKTNAAMKNISQLTHDIDSLNKRYTTKVDENFKEFSSSLLFTHRVQYFNTESEDNSDVKQITVFNSKVLFDSSIL